jgi:hypothetical protein
MTVHPGHDRASGRDRFARIAENVHVVEATLVRTTTRGENVRALMPAAQPCFDDGDVDLAAANASSAAAVTASNRVAPRTPRPAVRRPPP